jgi:hypothetical protein
MQHLGKSSAHPPGVMTVDIVAQAGPDTSIEVQTAPQCSFTDLSTTNSIEAGILMHLTDAISLTSCEKCSLRGGLGGLRPPMLKKSEGVWGGGSPPRQSRCFQWGLESTKLGCISFLDKQHTMCDILTVPPSEYLKPACI